MVKGRQGFDPRVGYSLVLKSLKKTLPKECTFLSPFTNRKGQNMVKFIVAGQDYYLTIPPNFVFNDADLNEMRESILLKIELCQQRK